MLIAITGNIGSGKSFISKLLQKLGYKVIFTDILAKRFIYHDCRKEIAKKFYLSENWTIHDLKLFESNNLEKLEKIIHPQILKYIQAFHFHHSQSCYDSLIFVEIPILYEKELQSYFDKVIGVYTAERIKQKRIFASRKIVPEYYYFFTRRQFSAKILRRRASFVIDNSYSKFYTCKNLLKILSYVLNLK